MQLEHLNDDGLMSLGTLGVTHNLGKRLRHRDNFRTTTSTQEDKRKSEIRRRNENIIALLTKQASGGNSNNYRFLQNGGLYSKSCGRVVTSKMLLRFLYTGTLCGKRMAFMRFGLTGK